SGVTSSVFVRPGLFTAQLLCYFRYPRSRKRPGCWLGSSFGPEISSCPRTAGTGSHTAGDQLANGRHQIRRYDHDCLSFSFVSSLVFSDHLLRWVFIVRQDLTNPFFIPACREI